MEGLQPYDKYKGSGIEWLGNIPEHWKKNKIGRSFNTIGSGATPTSSNTNYYEDGHINWLNTGDLNDDFILKTSRKITDLAFKETSALKIYPINSVIIALYGATIGKLGMLGIEATTNQACCVVTNSKYISQKFLFYYLYTSREHLISLSYGGGQPNISQEIIKQLPIVYPDVIEQQKIAEYLDFTTSKIDTIIEQKETLVRCLEEKRAAVINEAVTKGLNPDAPMKDSGIEWVGMIPKHWKINKIGRSFNCIGSGSTPKSSNSKYYEDGYINWLNTGDLNDNKITKTSKKITDLAFKETSALRVYPINSVVIALYGATIGKLGLLDIETTTNQACCVISDSKDISQYFLFYFLYASREYIISLAYGGGQPNISQELIKQLSIVYPDSSIEQQQIVEFIIEKTNKIGAITSELKIQIDRLREYRQSVIAEAVTGKVDLRNWQKPLN